MTALGCRNVKLGEMSINNYLIPANKGKLALIHLYSVESVGM